MPTSEASLPFLTIFTAPKGFENPHISLIQRNALRSWLQLGDDVEVLVTGDEPGLSQVTAELGIRYLPEVARNSQGTPLVSSIFEMARRHSQSPLLAYVNADIVLLPDFIEVSRKVASDCDRFLLVGQRWDLDVRRELEFGEGWHRRLSDQIAGRGRLHPPGGSDYFIYPRSCFTNMPAFAIGRAGWDNWMIYQARREGLPVVDATQAITIIHQDHDYSHLPGSQSHYRLPETTENVRLAGGRRAIFSLADANYTVKEGCILPKEFTWDRLLREVETFPLVRLKSKGLGELFFAIFHPRKAWGEWRGRLSYKLRRSPVK
jgi:hypothetical protein